MNATTLSVSPTAGSLNTGKSIRIRYIVGSVYDEITIVKVSDGANGTNGTNGANGANGADAYTVILTNETHTFPTQNNGNIPTALSTTTQVVAYKGATSVTPTIGTLPSVAGLTLSKSGATITIKANTGTSLADSGSFNIPVTVDGKSFTKTFSWSKSKQGSTGATGATGATGPAGANAKAVDIIASSQVFKSTDGGTTFSPDTITLTPKLQSVNYSNWQYSTNGGSSWATVTSGQNGLSISGNVLSISKNSPLFTKTVTTVVFRVNTNDSSVYDTMSIVKLYDVTDLEVGGRNYIKYGKGDKKSGFFQHFTTVANGYGEHTLTSKKTYANVNIAPGFVLGCRDYEVGRKVTFSYEIMFTKWDFPSGTNRSEWWIGQRYTNSSTSTDGQWRDVTKHNLPVVGENGCELNKWFKVTKVLTIPAQAHSSIGTASSIQFYNSNESTSASVTFRIRNVKIEYGNKATDWSPSPEEVKDDANQSAQNAVNAQTQLSIFNKLTNNGQTQGIYLENSKVYINGEYIKASSIHADRIKAGTLTANMITSGTFKGVNFEAGGSGTAGVMLVKDTNNNITFTASKNGINTKRISFVDTLKNDGTFVTSASTVLTSSGYAYSRSESSSSYTATDALSFVGTTLTCESALNRTDGSNTAETVTVMPSGIIVKRTTAEKGSNAGNVTIAPLSLTLTTQIYGETNTNSCMIDMYNNQFRIRVGGSGTASNAGFAIHGPGDTMYANIQKTKMTVANEMEAPIFRIPSPYGSNYITKGTGDGNTYSTYNIKFRTHNSLGFTANDDSVTVLVQGRQGRIMGKNAYYVSCSRALKSDIRAVVSDREPMVADLREGETVDQNITTESVCDFLDNVGVRTYITDFNQKGVYQEDVDNDNGHCLCLGYIADEMAKHPMFKYIGEETADGLHAINTNALTTALIVGYQEEKKERLRLEDRVIELEERLARLERLLETNI